MRVPGRTLQDLATRLKNHSAGEANPPDAGDDDDAAATAPDASARQSSEASGSAGQWQTLKSVW